MEKAFTKALLEAAEQAELAGVRSRRFPEEIRKYGGVSACRNFLKKGFCSETFEALIRAGRPELTAEAVIVKKEFAPLFTDDEVNACFALLCEAGYYGQGGNR